MVLSLPFPLDSMPRLVQCGLCVHGLRAEETFVQRGLWSLHVYHYPGELRFRGAVYSFASGWASLVPPDEEVTWRFPAHAAHFYAHFRSGVRPGELTELPLLQELGARAAQMESRMSEMIQFFPSDNSRCDVRLWDILHGYALGPHVEPQTPGLHPSVQIALSILRNHPGQRVRVADIAQKMGVSHNHLTLLFKKQFGCGVKDFIGREQMEKAHDKLLNTSMPIKTIAAECGFSDLQYFNKVMRAAFGKSPTAMRVRR